MSGNAVVNVYRLDFESIVADFDSRGYNTNNLDIDTAINTIMDPAESGKDALNLPYSASLSEQNITIDTNSLGQLVQRFGINLDGNLSRVSYRLFFGEIKTPESWGHFFNGMSNANSTYSNLENVQYSFLFYVVIGGSAYVLSSGLAYHQISRYIDEFFGVTVVSHLIDTSDTDIRSLQDNAIYGSVLSSDRYFGNEFKIFNEDTFGKVYKKVLAEVKPGALQTEFPFLFNSSNAETRNCLGKSCFTLYKSISYLDALLLIFKLHELYLRGMNPNLDISNIKILKKSNPADKVKIQELFESVIDDFMTAVYGSNLSGSYLILPQNIVRFFSGANFSFNYMPQTSNSRAILNTSNVNNFKIEDLITAIKGDTQYMQQLSNAYSDPDKYKKLKKKLNQLVLNVSSPNYNVPLTDKFLRTIITETRNAGFNYFLLNGTWFRFENAFVTRINQNLGELLNSIEDSSIMPSRWNANQNEDAYIDGYTAQNTRLANYIPIHKTTPSPNNVELADIIKLDGNKIYLIHIKKGFDNKVREVSSQIVTSARLLIDDIKNNNLQWVEAIYNDISNRSQTSGYLSRMKSKFLAKWPRLQDFKNEFLTRDIVYCMAYTGNQSNTPVSTQCSRYRSQIAKMTVISLDKQFSSIKGRKWDFVTCQIQR